jgi:hypothetical protein
MKRWLIYQGLLNFLLAQWTLWRNCATHSVTRGLQIDPLYPMAILRYPPSQHK